MTLPYRGPAAGPYLDPATVPYPGPAAGPYRPARYPRLPLRLLLRAPAFAAVGSYTGTCLTVRAWAACPLGNDAEDGLGLTMTMVTVFALMTMTLLVTQYLLWAAAMPVPALRCLRWVAPVCAAVVLTMVYRAGMGSPDLPVHGDCVQGYPPFPFEPRPTP